MKGFKNSTRTQYAMGGSCDAYAKGGSVKGAAKVGKVMGEFKRGELHSGSKDGPKVTKPAQAKAIAMSEARKAGMKAPVKKNEGGKIGKMPPIGESVKSGNRASKMTAAEMREMEKRFGEKKRPSPADSAKSGNRVSSQEAAEARHMGVYKHGGKVAKYAQGGSVRPDRTAAVDPNKATNQYFADLGSRVKAGTMTADQARAAQVQFRNQVQKSKAPVTGQMAEAAARNITRSAMQPSQPAPARPAMPTSGPLAGATMNATPARNPLAGATMNAAPARNPLAGATMNAAPMGNPLMRRAMGGLAAMPKKGKC